MARYKETVIGPRHDAMRAVIRQGIAAGELRADTDVEIALLALTGTVLAKEKAADGSLDGEFAARIVDEVLLGLSAR
jgi:Tetracyclin repressor-like, C-terminal domain